MTAQEQKTINQVSTLQAVMKEKQHNMQSDINELKKLVKETNEQIQELNKKFDTLAGGKQALIWITGVFIATAGLIISYLNFRHKS